MFTTQQHTGAVSEGEQRQKHEDVDLYVWYKYKGVRVYRL